MDLLELQNKFKLLGDNYKTKDLDNLNKSLIKEKIDVSFLKDVVLERQEFHRTYFQVSLAQLKTIEQQYEFIENNFLLLNDWWHVDQLTQFLRKQDFEYSFNKAKVYINHPHPFARRWGYVLFMPTLVKQKEALRLFELFKNDSEYYVIMAEAWLISYLGIYYPSETYEYLLKCSLNYDIVGRGIQKICDSFRISNEWKERFKSIREKYKRK
jgi:3-methyladenine DNA glycosylase AlkD